MNRRIRKRGAVVAEVLFALILLALNGMLIAYVFSRFGDPAPCYAWATVGLILPLEAVLAAAVARTADQRAVQAYRQRQGRP